MKSNWIVATLGVGLLGALLALGGCGGDSGGGGPTFVAPPRPPLQGSCAPSSSLSVLIQGTNVTSYVPKGSWSASSTGVSLVQIEGSGTTATVIPTANVVNSCASNGKTGVTVCVANNTDVYTLSGSTLTQTLTSAGSGSISFSGGICTNCGISIDSVDDLGLIGLSLADVGGFQFLGLSGTPTLAPAFATASGEISEDALVDPVHKLILSATESGVYEIIKKGTTNTPEFFENTVGEGTLDSSAEDCQTGIALASIEGTDTLFLADLEHATFTSGSPSGKWTAPSQIQTFPDFEGLGAGTCGIAIAQETHIGVVTGEFGGNKFGAIKLPSSSGGGTPAATDWIACNVPNDPTATPWEQGFDPHPVTAYKSPNSGDAIALMANNDGNPTFVAVVDLTKLLNPSIVARTTPHLCDPTVNLVTAGVVSFVPVP